jgi:hypothetical protein
MHLHGHAGSDASDLPEDLGDAIAFLAGPHGAAVNGQVLPARRRSRSQIRGLDLDHAAIGTALPPRAARPAATPHQ